MCTVSNVGDYYKNNFLNTWPNININNPQVSKFEFEQLKKEVQELKKLLKAAKKFDEETNQHDCHMDEKVEFIKKIAEFVGVDLEDIFKK